MAADRPPASELIEAMIQDLVPLDGAGAPRAAPEDFAPGAGYREIADYNGNPHASFFGEKAR